MFSAVAGALSPKTWKIVGGVVGVLAVLGAVLALVLAVRSWTTEIYNDGFRAGSDMVSKQWEAANAKAVTAQRDQIVKDVAQSNQSVKDYLADILAREPEVIKVKERTIVYEKSEDGSSLCLTPDGVRLLEDHRTAIGYPARSPDRTPGAVSGVVPVGTPAVVEP